MRNGRLPQKYNAFLNDGEQGLAELDSRIRLVDIQESVKTSIVSQDKASLGGKWDLLGRRDSLTVTLHMQIKAATAGEREYLAQKVNRFCEDGVLRISTRPGECLHGRFTHFASPAMRDWPSAFDVQFTASDFPFRISDRTETFSDTSRDWRTEMTLGGSGPCLLSVSIRNEEELPLTMVIIETGAEGDTVSRMEMRNLSLPEHTVLRVDHDRLLRPSVSAIGTDGSTQMLHPYAPQLFLLPGTRNTVHVATDRICHIQLCTREVYR